MTYDGTDRREDGGIPPTLIEASYLRMGKGGRRRLRLAGGCMTAIGILTPMTAGLVKHLELVYWIFSAVVALVGLGMIWPEYGIELLNYMPGAVTRLLRPDRRDEPSSDA